MQFEASFLPESYLEGGAKPILVHICDYASAGNSSEGFPFFKSGCHNYLIRVNDPRIARIYSKVF
jgi:hypothetical protein